MYAVVEIAGQQFKVSKNQKIFVHRLQEKEGSTVSFDKVYLFNDGKKTTVGAPNVSKTSVQAKVIKHFKGEKVIVFKKKRRKGYRVKNGHRQLLTELVINSIGINSAKKSSSLNLKEGLSEKKETPKKVLEKKSTPKKVEKKATSKKVEKKATAKKSTTKKPTKK